MAKTTSKVKTKKLSAQVQFKLNTMDEVKKLLISKGLKVVDCREISLEGATKFTLFARGENADLKMSFISKPDKKSPYYESVDDALGEELCDDEG